MLTKAASLHTAAANLDEQGYDDLAALIGAIATAHDQVRSASLVPLDEALRWSPVVSAAVNFIGRLDK